MKKANNFQIEKVQSQGVAYPLLNFFANFNLTLLIKVLLIQEKCMQHIQKPGKHGKSWFLNFSSYSQYYLQHFSKRCMCLSLKVLIRIINVNVVMKLKRCFLCS